MWRKAASIVLLGGFLVSHSMGARVILQPSRSMSGSPYRSLSTQGTLGDAAAGAVLGAVIGYAVGSPVGAAVGAAAGGALCYLGYFGQRQHGPTMGRPATLLD